MPLFYASEYIFGVLVIDCNTVFEALLLGKMILCAAGVRGCYFWWDLNLVCWILTCGLANPA